MVKKRFLHHFFTFFTLKINTTVTQPKPQKGEKVKKKKVKKLLLEAARLHSGLQVRRFAFCSFN